MKTTFLKLHLPLLLILFVCPAIHAQTTQQLLSSSGSDSWAAIDALGRELPAPASTAKIREGKYVGMFYFIWHGAHGYDQHSATQADEGVRSKTPSDTVSPYDNTQFLKANPTAPQYGPVHAFHHWGEPYFGYYLSDDEWVIRKHAQMLSDAGVDVIIIDVTNASIYLPQVTRIATIYQEMRKEGRSTPSISFIINSNPEATVQRLYDNFYKKGLFSDLWFYWKGKPLLLCPPESATEETRNFFSIRRSWAWSKGQKWFGDGKDKWPWLDHTPQSYGWHESPDKAEQVSVAIAEHPMSNIGRSFHDRAQPTIHQTDKGLYFKEQWQRALEVDPEFVFVTGWNEWVAMRFIDGASKYFLGKAIEKGETYFVDCYNAEYSRDAEPAKDDLIKDNYYYQLVDYIRQFKGARPATTFSTRHTIKTDGNFGDWKNVQAIFTDDKGDTRHRKHPGWGRIKEYVNTSGRNDIIETRVANDATDVFFYVKTAQPLTPRTSENWMQLLIGIKDSRRPAWEGFHFRVNRTPKSSSETSLERYSERGEWLKTASVSYAAGSQEIEFRIPKKALGSMEASFTIDFKWQDNVPLDGDPLHWLDKGDTAPNARFRYRYHFQP